MVSFKRMLQSEFLKFCEFKWRINSGKIVKFIKLFANCKYVV